MTSQQTGLFQAKPTTPTRPPFIGGGGSNGNSTASGNENINIMPAIIPEPSPANPDSPANPNGSRYTGSRISGLFGSVVKETEAAANEAAAVIKETTESNDFKKIVDWCKKNWVILAVVALVWYLSRK